MKSWVIKALIFLILVTGILHTLYIFKTEQYPVWDEHHYLFHAVSMYDLLQEKGIGALPNIVARNSERQPLYSLIIAIILLVTGTDHTYRIALLLNGIFFCFSILGIYCLSKQFLRSIPSFIAAFLFATYGSVLFYAHFTYVETAVTTMIIWSLFFLVKTNTFSHRSYTIVTGLVTGLATLTRFVAPAFLLGPILTTIIYAFIRHKDRQKIVVNIGIFLLFSISLPLIFYFLPNKDAFATYVTNNQKLGAQWVSQYRDPAMANTFSIRSIMYYFNILQQNTIGMFLLFLGGWILLCISLYPFKRKLSTLFTPLFLLSSFIVPYSFLTFITIWKEDRFLVSLYPSVALISAYLFEKIKKKIILNFLIVVTIGVGILNALGAQWGMGPMGARGLVDVITPRWWPHPRRIYITPLVWPPQKDHTETETVITILENDWKQPTKATAIYTASSEPLYNALYGRTMYEKRNLLHFISPSATPSATTDYLFTNTLDTKTNRLVAVITVPQDKSTVYIYALNH